MGTISITFTGALLLLLYHAPALLCSECTSGIVSAIVHVLLQLGFTAAAAGEELRSRQQQYANSAAAAAAAIQARREEMTQLAGVCQVGYEKQNRFIEIY